MESGHSGVCHPQPWVYGAFYSLPEEGREDDCEADGDADAVDA